MERVISSIVSFPSSQSLSPVEYNKELRALHDVLSKTHPSTLAGVSKDNDPLHILNNEQHSLGVLFILSVARGSRLNPDILLTEVAHSSEMLELALINSLLPIYGHV